MDKVAVYSIVLDLYKFGVALIGRIAGVLYTNLNFSKDFYLLKKVTVGSLMTYLALLPLVIFFGEPILAFVFDFEVKEVHRASMLLYCSLFMVIISSYWTYPALTAANLALFSKFVRIRSINNLLCIIWVSLLPFNCHLTRQCSASFFDITLLICVLSVVVKFYHRFSKA